MADSKTSNADEPQNITQLIGQTPELTDLPELVQTEDFTALNSADFALLAAAVSENSVTLRRKTASMTDKALAIRGIIANADFFFKGIAKDGKAYDEWSKDRTPDELFTAYMALFGFYAGRLGKSKRSSADSKNAESN
ncbi:hypothetical protein [Bifidobacterium olomucense]|uniref:Uncharacterized protein n=1 Tax=Bifidobacterium olomucense TaxID=2675324 RepID=A0A7Y0EXZ7_9BIFI|nr:hypothetical protein [Bifidobacterium sp. DSM 109959]NMM98158.1 hypothetical protein [Bifidobacterium sp. DSM 109959]